MPSIVELDLRGVGLPICLLKCKSALIGMDRGNILEVLVNDSEILEDLVKIVKRSQSEMILQSHREGDHYRIRIGPSSKMGS